MVTLPLSSTHLPHLPFFPFPSSSLRGLRVHMAVFLSFSSPLRHHFLREDSVGLHLSGPCVSLYHTTLISHNTSCLWVFLCLSSSPSAQTTLHPPPPCSSSCHPPPTHPQVLENPLTQWEKLGMRHRPGLEALHCHFLPVTLNVLLNLSRLQSPHL